MAVIFGMFGLVFIDTTIDRVVAFGKGNETGIAGVKRQRRTVALHQAASRC